MRFDYSKWKGPKPGDEAFLKQLMDIYRNLLLQTGGDVDEACLLYTSPSPRDGLLSRMPSSA